MREKVNYRGDKDFTSLLEKVRELRRGQTKVEKLFWESVRNRKLNGLKFRRQHQIDRFIVDFFCASESLIIEIDGKVHLKPDQREKDISRDNYLKELGYGILRFSNNQIYYEIENVLDEIRESIQ